MQDVKEITEIKKESNNEKQLFKCSCDMCGKHFLSIDFFQTICKDCIDDFVHASSMND